MRRFGHGIAILAILTLLPGCGDSRDKGINKDKDRPKPAQAAPEKPKEK